MKGKNMEHRIRVTIDLWLARIGSAFGWFWAALYALVAVVGFADLPSAKDRTDTVMPFVCVCLAAVHFLIVRVSGKTRKLVGDFRYYAAFLAGNKSVAALSRQAGEPEKDVERKLILMCRRGYFKGHVDLAKGCLVLHEAQSACAAKCPGCGATTKIFKNGDICRYCGNPLMKEEQQ